ncbi:hypothetical protein H257_01855 [Aphanomyces astaci]|uniref:Uncharacterized protein n=1 Tax=Aphanomyces astaci TaxID=112090 RepID=W4H4F2_APHAT|nr:hypothetical protein H257_01855 [Aphanomyces astaci]ETV86772.1 hypothetical protein H257_01855 [Aphanomyces astaci]|eukprot:XP_009823571.1 hypothetical protein H257_01855 [Aphanomyces astaci]
MGYCVVLPLQAQGHTFAASPGTTPAAKVRRARLAQLARAAKKADTGATLVSFQAQDAASRAKISADTSSAAVVATNASAPATSVSSTPSDPRSQPTGYTIVSFIKRRRAHNDPEYTYIAKVRTEQGSMATHLFRESDLPNRAVSIFEAYDAYCNTSPPPLPTTYSAWPKS